MKLVFNLFTIPIVLFLAILASMFFVSIINPMNLLEDTYSKFIFFPSKEFYFSPKAKGISFEEVYINTLDGEKLHGYFFPSQSEKTKKIFIYLHGNAENVSTWYPAVVEIQTRVPANALIVDYRGYGKSTGKPSIQGVIKDAHAMYKYLTDNGYNPEEISLYGRSIGGAIALELAQKEKVKSIVIQSSFTSLKNIAKELYPYIPDILIKNDFFNSIKSIKKVHCPILISHGSNDDIVPINHSKRLFEAANEPKKLIILKGATHNDISSSLTDEYFNTLKELFL